ncbi:MAG: DUF3109 family protein [Muribaculaceae bacterium]|nr:DUF3109 family protein [Muribaculaceae bacterium]
MFVIKDTLVSLDLIEKFFVCDLEVCKGQCCIDGDAGAPLLDEEKIELDNNVEKILPFLTPGGQKAIMEDGTAYYDKDGDLVTTLVEGCNCAFTTFSEDGTCLCALEKAYREKKLPQLKPSSCHLYPVRLVKMGDMTALNLHKWKICKCAEKKGKELNVRAYEFLKAPLIRKFGQEWYDELEIVAEEWLKKKN